MVSGMDVLFTDLEESIPYVLVNAMRSGEANVVRGLQAMSGAIMWHFTHAAIHLIEVIVDARREDGVVYSGDLTPKNESSFHVRLANKKKGG